MKLYKNLFLIDIDEVNFPFFFHEKWISAESKNGDSSFLYVDKDKEFIIPFVIKKLKLINKAEYYYIPLNFKGNKLNPIEEKSAIENFHCFLKTNKKCDVILPPQHIISFQCIPEKSIYFEIGILNVELESDEISYQKQLSSENRRQIRQAKTNNIEVKFGSQYIFDFYSTYCQTNKNKNLTSLNLEYFERMIEDFEDNCLIGVCYLDNTPLASVFDIIDSKQAYSLFSGTIERLPVKGAKKMLINEEFNLLRKKNINTYVFGGYRQDLDNSNSLYHVQAFKKSMGAVNTRGIHFICIFNPIKYFIFNTLLNLKSIVFRKELSLINLNGVEIKKLK